MLLSCITAAGLEYFMFTPASGKRTISARRERHAALNARAALHVARVARGAVVRRGSRRKRHPNAFNHVLVGGDTLSLSEGRAGELLCRWRSVRVLHADTVNRWRVESHSVWCWSGLRSGRRRRSGAGEIHQRVRPALSARAL